MIWNDRIQNEQQKASNGNMKPDDIRTQHYVPALFGNLGGGCNGMENIKQYSESLICMYVYIVLVRMEWMLF